MDKEEYKFWMRDNKDATQQFVLKGRSETTSQVGGDRPDLYYCSLVSWLGQVAMHRRTSRLDNGFVSEEWR